MKKLKSDKYYTTFNNYQLTGVICLKKKIDWNIIIKYLVIEDGLVRWQN